MIALERKEERERLERKREDRDRTGEKEKRCSKGNISYSSIKCMYNASLANAVHVENTYNIVLLNRLINNFNNKSLTSVDCTVAH